MSRRRTLTNWLEKPKSLPTALLSFALGFMIIQPPLLYVHQLFGEPVPFESLAHWGTFMLATVAFGLLAGGARYYSQHHSSAALRLWLIFLIYALLLAPTSRAERLLSAGVLPWLLSELLISVVLSTLFLGVVALVIVLSPRKNRPRNAA